MALDHTYQLNFGGNMDFKNMLERKRLQSKKISKTQSVTSQITQGIDEDDVHIGPSDHVPWLDDRKWAYIRLEGRNFGDVPLNVELKLEVWDSPELGRRDHRRRALRQDRPGPRHRRPAARPVGVLHEVAARAVPRRGGPRDGRGVRADRAGPRRLRYSRHRRSAGGGSSPGSRAGAAVVRNMWSRSLAALAVVALSAAAVAAAAGPVASAQFDVTNTNDLGRAPCVRPSPTPRPRPATTTW